MLLNSGLSDIINRGIVMKKIIFSILTTVIIILVVVAIKISDTNAGKITVRKFNNEFESFKEKQIYGADVLTIINKAIENNTEHDIQKDEEGMYKEDDTYSVKVDIILLSTDKDGNINEVKHPMESLQKART